MEKDETLEKLAAIEHDRWSAWHEYARSNWTPENIARWDRQAKTPYSELSEQEKESDRIEVRKYYPCVILEAGVVGKMLESLKHLSKCGYCYDDGIRHCSEGKKSIELLSLTRPNQSTNNGGGE